MIVLLAIYMQYCMPSTFRLGMVPALYYVSYRGTQLELK